MRHRNDRIQGGVNGFIVFATVSVTIAFLAGFVHGVAVEPHPQRPIPANYGEPVGSRSQHEPDVQRHQPQKHGVPQTDENQLDVTGRPDSPSGDEDFRKALEQLLTDGPSRPEPEPDDTPEAAKPDQTDLAVVPVLDPLEDPAPPHGRTENQGGVNMVRMGDGDDDNSTYDENDPEQDLFRPPPMTSTTAAPDNEDVTKADRCLNDAKALLAKWIRTRSKQDVVNARETLQEAKVHYHNAEKSLPNNHYIRERLKLANQLLYAAMKSSPF